MRFRDRIGFTLGFHLPPMNAHWANARYNEKARYQHPCDSASKYRICWGAMCECHRKRRPPVNG